MAGRRQAAQSQSTSPATSQTSTQTVERRRRLALRALVEEMLTDNRSAAGASEENRTPEERQRAEADLARIMDQVRREAFRNSPAE
jgi:predicted transcriptional regulator